MNDIRKYVSKTPVSTTGKNVVARYLLKLRDILERDNTVNHKVANCISTEDARPILIEAFGPVEPGTEELLERSITILLEELKQQRASKPSMYLVNRETGMSLMPIDAKDIYTPPDYKDPGGETWIHRHIRSCKARSIVHPGISSSIALSAHEANKENAIIALAGDALAFKHMSEPEQITEMAKQRLTGLVNFGDANGQWEEIQFGRENIAGMEQAVNTSFHRIELFSVILAKKILHLCGSGGTCQLGSITVRKSPKYRWYVLTGIFEKSNVVDTDKKLGQHT